MFFQCCFPHILTKLLNQIQKLYPQLSIGAGTSHRQSAHRLAPYRYIPLCRPWHHLLHEEDNAPDINKTSYGVSELGYLGTSLFLEHPALSPETLPTSV